jgi:hypothetical protein
MPVAQAFKARVWPAIWPVAGLFASLWVGEFFEPVRLSAHLLDFVVAGLVYQALFLLDRPAQERQLYWTKLKEVLRQRRAVAVAA